MASVAEYIFGYGDPNIVGQSPGERKSFQPVSRQQEFNRYMKYNVTPEFKAYLEEAGMDPETYFNEFYDSGREDFPDNRESLYIPIDELLYDPSSVLNKTSSTSDQGFPAAPADPSIGGGNNMIGSPDAADPDPLNVSTTEETEEGKTEKGDDGANDIDYEPKPGGRIYGQRGPFNMPRGPGMVRLGPNVSFPVGPFLAGGAAVSINRSDDEETQIPVFMPDSPDGEPPRRPPPDPEEPQPNMATRIIPSTQAGTLPELSTFMGEYTPAATDIVGDMAELSGAGFDAFARNELGMTGDEQIDRFDVAREAASQQTDALGGVFGLGPGATYADITAAGTAPMQGLSQVRGTVLPGLQSAFGAAQERLENPFSARRLQDVQQQARARFGNRLMDTAAFAGEVTDVASEDAGLFSRSLQDLLGIGQTTSNIAQQEAYAMSPFTEATIASADLTPGIRLAGDVSRQASAATPSPMELFGLEGQERQFGLDQEALRIGEKASDLNLLGNLFGLLQPRGGASAGLVQQGPATIQIGGYGGPIEYGNPYTRQFG